MDKEFQLDPVRDAVARNDTIYATRQFDDRVKVMIARRVLPLVKGPRVANLGYCGDDWTDHLLTRGHVDIIEGNSAFCDDARQRYNGRNVRVFHSMFEDFKPDVEYDSIIMASAIEHLSNPDQVLASIRSWMSPTGVLVLTTKNRRSLHRRLGVAMGLETSTEQLNEAALATHALRLYDRYDLASLLRQCGWNIQVNTGMFLKVLPTAMMETLSDALLEGYMSLGDELADYCKELVFVCTPNPEV